MPYESCFGLKKKLDVYVQILYLAEQILLYESNFVGMLDLFAPKVE